MFLVLSIGDVMANVMLFLLRGMVFYVFLMTMILLVKASIDSL
jgi:hypothetical protein